MYVYPKTPERAARILQNWYRRIKQRQVVTINKATCIIQHWYRHISRRVSIRTYLTTTGYYTHRFNRRYRLRTSTTKVVRTMQQSCNSSIERVRASNATDSTKQLRINRRHACLKQCLEQLQSELSNEYGMDAYHLVPSILFDISAQDWIKAATTIQHWFRRTRN